MKLPILSFWRGPHRTLLKGPLQVPRPHFGNHCPNISRLYGSQGQNLKRLVILCVCVSVRVCVCVCTHVCVHACVLGETISLVLAQQGLRGSTRWQCWAFQRRSVKDGDTGTQWHRAGRSRVGEGNCRTKAMYSQTLYSYVYMVYNIHRFTIKTKKWSI